MKNILLLSLIVLTGCGSAPVISPEQIEAKKRVSNEALRASVICGENNISGVDDGISDASTVALALASKCFKEYNFATYAFGEAELDNDNQKRMFQNKRREVKSQVEMYLPIVMRYRNLKSKIERGEIKEPPVKNETEKKLNEKKSI